MQKIGISKLKENNKSYFSTLHENKIINFNDTVQEINSIIIKPTCINIELIKNSDKLRLTIKTDIKVIYLKENDTSLYVYKSSYINYQLISLPKIIDGHYLYDIGLINKIKKEVYVENINTKLINNSLILGYFLSVNIRVSPTYYLAYSINNGFCDNIFLSHINGQVLTQKTFNQDMKCSKLKWSTNGSTLCYIATINNINCIYLIDVVNNNVINFTNVNNLNNVIDFDFINNNEILLLTSEENINNLFIYNLNRNKVKKITPLKEGAYIYKPYYDIQTKNIYFLCGDNSIKHLYSLNDKQHLENLFNYVDVIDYFVSYYSNNIVIKAIKDNKLSLFLLDIKTNFLTPIQISIPYEDIIDVKFINNTNLNKQLIILIKNKPGDFDTSLILYDLNNFNCKLLLKENIKEIDIDYITLNAFLICFKNNINTVEVISINDLLNGLKPEPILTLPVNIKTLCIKKVANEK